MLWLAITSGNCTGCCCVKPNLKQCFFVATPGKFEFQLPCPATSMWHGVSSIQHTRIKLSYFMFWTMTSYSGYTLFFNYLKFYTQTHVWSFVQSSCFWQKADRIFELFAVFVCIWTKSKVCLHIRMNSSLISEIILY